VTWEYFVVDVLMSRCFRHDLRCTALNGRSESKSLCA
jgi:hypothetical protein